MTGTPAFERNAETWPNAEATHRGTGLGRFSSAERLRAAQRGVAGDEFGGEEDLPGRERVAAETQGHEARGLLADEARGLPHRRDAEGPGVQNVVEPDVADAPPGDESESGDAP